MPPLPYSCCCCCCDCRMAFALACAMLRTLPRTGSPSLCCSCCCCGRGCTCSPSTLPQVGWRIPTPRCGAELVLSAGPPREGRPSPPPPPPPSISSPRPRDTEPRPADASERRPGPLRHCSSSLTSSLLCAALACRPGAPLPATPLWGGGDPRPPLRGCLQACLGGDHVASTSTSTRALCKRPPNLPSNLSFHCAILQPSCCIAYNLDWCD